MGMIGMGRMGAGMTRRLLRAEHGVVVYDVRKHAAAALSDDGAVAVETLDELAAALEPPRVAWLMLPAAAVSGTIEALAALLEPNDVIVDGGNGFYGDDIRRAQTLEARGLHYIDVGVSGGVWGEERGYCQMIGGRADVVDRLVPLFAALSPGLGATPRTPGSADRPSNAERGYLHCGPSGAGHFVKMVHNAIEYGMMASYAEGLAILRHANAGRRARGVDAETAPLREPELYAYDFDLAAIAELWRRGSVIGSWLLDLLAQSLAADPDLQGFTGRVSDSGEGRWAIQAAVDEGVPAAALYAALAARFTSRDDDAFANKVVSALRDAFGGHREGRS
ncbi:6-phosphogluconate dehydrogenase, decarboxylating [Minicystis rosea]|nr:6-phosphogluconate dehydrogenase, decarboxylating [Minicystis rosea]